MQRVAHGRSRSLACCEPSETPEAQHGCTIAFALQQWHIAFSGGSSFSRTGQAFFLLFRFFPFIFLSWTDHGQVQLASIFFFNYLERDCLLCAICDAGQLNFLSNNMHKIFAFAFFPDRSQHLQKRCATGGPRSGLICYHVQSRADTAAEWINMFQWWVIPNHERCSIPSAGRAVQHQDYTQSFFAQLEVSRLLSIVRRSKNVSYVFCF